MSFLCGHYHQHLHHMYNQGMVLNRFVLSAHDLLCNLLKDFIHKRFLIIHQAVYANVFNYHYELLDVAFFFCLVHNYF